MNTLSGLTDKDYEKMAIDIEAISKKDESEIYKSIGKALHREGYTVSSANASYVLKPKINSLTNERFNILESLSFISDALPQSDKKAKEEGENFWHRFKDQLQHVICTNPDIINLINGKGKLKEYLSVGIPIVAAALSLSIINPAMLVIIASVFALIIKVGFNAYCNIDPKLQISK